MCKTTVVYVLMPNAYHTEPCVIYPTRKEAEVSLESWLPETHHVEERVLLEPCADARRARVPWCLFHATLGVT